MIKIEFNEKQIHDYGVKHEIGGIVYRTPANSKIMVLLPDEEHGNGDEIFVMETSLEDWKKIIRQTDLLETYVFQDPNNKIIVRKSARQIDQRVAWKVYERDHYTCQYCGIQGVPMSIDHLITWETGGATVEDNLLTTCKKCNKTRGNTPIDEWLESDAYKRRSAKAPSYLKDFCKDMAVICQNTPRMKHIKKR